MKTQGQVFSSRRLYYFHFDEIRGDTALNTSYILNNFNIYTVIWLVPGFR